MLVAASALVLLAADGAARADEDADAQTRATLTAQLTSLLNDLAGRLPADVSGALAKNDDIKSALDQLDAVKGEDSAAASLLSQWRDEVALFPAAANALAQLTTAQDQYASFDATCQAQDAALRAQLKKYVDDKNTNGLTEAPPLAQSALAPLKPTWDAAEAMNTTLTDAHDTIGNFKGDGAWSTARDNLKRGGDDAWTKWDRNRQEYTRSCTPLLSPNDHPALVATVKFLGDLKAARDQLVDTMRMNVRGVATTVSDATSSSDDGLIASSEARANQIQTNLADLTPLAGTDAPANTMLTKWPQILKDFLNAESALRQLKQFQHTLDNGRDTCNSAGRQLQNAINDALQNTNDPKGAATTLTTNAKSLAAPIVDSLARATASLDTVKKARDTVKAFAPDDDSWKEVSTAMAQSADALEQYWEGMLAQSHASCDVVAKADGNPDVVAALGIMTQTGQNAAAGFIALADRWMADARACYRVDCDGMQSIWTAFCGDDWEEGDDPDKDGGRSAANDIRSQMQSTIQPVLDRYAAVEAAAQVPLNNPDTHDDTQHKYDDLKAVHDKLQSLPQTGAYRGADHPLVQHAIEYGKQRHRDMSDGCDVADKSFPGSDERPDCVVFADCIIYEFKPDNQKAIDKGNRQLDNYRELVRRYYQDLIDNGGSADDDHGGSGAIQKLTDAKCIDDDKKIAFKTEVKTYSMCENEYQCVQ